MIGMKGKQIIEFFHRSYTAADGLWFVKVEEKYGFDAALEIDNEVWKTLPKIQVRMLKSVGKMDGGMKALSECLETKLTLDGFDFRVETIEDDHCYRVIINRCPWHDLMIKSGRESLSGRVGNVICNAEYLVWASEFGDDICFELREQICQGAESCVLEFTQR